MRLRLGSKLEPMERRLAELGIDLSRVVGAAARGNYVFATKSNGGRIVHLAGHIPFNADGTPIEGMIGEHSKEKVFTVEEGYGIARSIGISLLKSLNSACDGQLDNVQQILKINGLLRCESADFGRHPEVINGVSDLMIQVFGEERGRHARAAYGVHSLPSRVPIEIDMIVELKP